MLTFLLITFSSFRNVNVDSCLYNFKDSISTCEKTFAEKQTTASDSIKLTYVIHYNIEKKNFRNTSYNYENSNNYRAAG